MLEYLGQYSGLIRLLTSYLSSKCLKLQYLPHNSIDYRSANKLALIHKSPSPPFFVGGEGRVRGYL